VDAKIEYCGSPGKILILGVGRLEYVVVKCMKVPGGFSVRWTCLWLSRLSGVVVRVSILFLSESRVDFLETPKVVFCYLVGYLKEFLILFLKDSLHG
jgi:hypothetical protein